MIDKKQAKENGINILETRDLPTNEYYSLMERLKELVPSIVNSDGVLDMEALQDVIDISQTTANNKGYELTFAGKGLAKAKADMPTEKELKVEKEQSKNFDTTGNVVIRGDNIEALKILKQNYTNKIKMIYIDPPYNTKSENFIYNDNFKLNDEQLIKEFALNEDTTNYLTNVYGTRSHSGWLSFMYPRLKLARDLLREDGVIFISIDDNEQAPLKLLCDELFGEDNFVGNIIWRKKEGGGQASENFAKEHEYILTYRKSDEFLWADEFISVLENDFTKKDAKGKFKTIKLAKWGNTARREDRPTMYFPIIDPDGKENTPVAPDGNEGRWRVGKSTMDVIIAENRIHWEQKNNVWVPYEKVYFEPTSVRKIKERSILYDLCSNGDGANQLTKLFTVKDIFINPKPTKLIQFLIKHATDRNDIVIDFFAGSGATGEAVLQLNEEDKENRKFILVQWDERIEESKPAFQFCKDNEFEPVISSITIERLHRAGEKILKDKKANSDMFSEDSQLDIGYKVFSLTDKPKYDFDAEGALHLNHDRKSPIDTLCNMLCATCKTLDTSIEVIKDGCLYRVDNEIYITGKVKAEELAEYKDLKINIDALADISLQDYLNLDVLNRENITVVY